MRAASPDEVGTALAVAGAIGGYFATVPAAGRTDWSPLSELITDPDRLAARVAVVCRRLGADRRDPTQRRACASLSLLGTAARVLSPALGAAVLAGVVPMPSADELLWAEPADAPLPLLAYDRPAGVIVDGIDDAAHAITDGVVTRVLLPLASAYEAGAGLPATIARGNLASALAGAATVLGSHAVARRCLELGPLAGTGAYVHPEDDTSLRRTSCCLYYRLPGGGLCGDCVLRTG